jgi:hypothetical protein
MDNEYLFESALVALGPPHRMPAFVAANRTLAAFNESVGEYNHFVQQVRGIVMPEYSYEAFSEWFHAKRR